MSMNGNGKGTQSLEPSSELQVTDKDLQKLLHVLLFTVIQRLGTNSVLVITNADVPFEPSWRLRYSITDEGSLILSLEPPAAVPQ